MKRLTIFLVLFVAAVAVAAAASGGWGTYHPKLKSWFGGGMYVGLTSPTDTANWVQTIKRCTLVYDMPSIPALGAGSACNETASATCTGVVFGDTVLLGLDQVPPTPFNGAPPVPFVHAADQIRARVCNDSTDGGALDWPDASYTFTWIH